MRDGTVDTNCCFEPINAEFRRCTVHGGTAIAGEFRPDRWGNVPKVHCGGEQSTKATKEDAQEIFGAKSRIEVGARRWLKRDPFFGNNRHAYCEMYVGDLCDEIDRLRNVICDYLGCDRHSAALAGNHDYRCPRSEHYRG